MLDPAGVCWQEPVPTLHFLCGDISAPCAQTLSRPLVPFPELAVVNVSSQLALGK